MKKSDPTNLKITFLITMIIIIPFDVNALSGWKRTVTKGKVDKITTERSYLYATDKRQIEVNSLCSTQASEEDQYGKCTHTVKILPEKKILNLALGETVFLTSIGGIATTEYGCCGGPNTIRFFDDSGKLLGQIDSFRQNTPPLSNRFDQNNIAIEDGRLLVLKYPEQIPADLQELLLIDHKNVLLPETIKLNLKKSDDCGYALDYTHLENNILSLTFTAYECALKTVELKCSKKDKEWNCTRG